MIEAYGEYVADKMDSEWNAYILSLMFRQLRGSRDGIVEQMQRENERVYSTLLTRVVRDPTAEKNQRQLPIWLRCPDLPVPKRAKVDISEVTINDGLHMHAIALEPP